MPIKAIALLSGGLDSMLAVKLIQEQGIEVIGVCFTSPFFGPERAKHAAEELGIQLHIVDLTEEIIPIVKEPKYGYGRNMNPCIDCHTLMVKKAGELMRKLGASFIITGEVLGERPKSQNPTALHIVARDSGLDGYLLRPLSAKLLPPTIPEEKGWVDRERLMGIKGRSRKPQMALAERHGLVDYPTPAGGCLLTDPGFSRRLRELLSENPIPEASDLSLLRYGRHFRSEEGARIVVARNRNENIPIMELARPGDYLIQVKDAPGPRTLVRGREITEKSLEVAAALTVRYSRARESERSTAVVSKMGEGSKQEITLERAKVQELTEAASPIGTS